MEKTIIFWTADGFLWEVALLLGPSCRDLKAVAEFVFSRVSARQCKVSYTAD